jgi:ABC-type iron transport system FetAB permease component
MVSLPGIMTVQVLGGAPLAEAVKSRILVMFRLKNGTP